MRRQSTLDHPASKTPLRPFLVHNYLNQCLRSNKIGFIQNEPRTGGGEDDGFSGFDGD